MYELDRYERRWFWANMERMMCGLPEFEAAAYLMHPDGEMRVLKDDMEYRYYACLARRFIGYMGRCYSGRDTDRDTAHVGRAARKFSEGA